MKNEIAQIAPKFLNQIGYTDITPYEVLSITPSGKTATIREMKAERDSTWSPEFVTGGFAGCCVNQHEQKWNITSDENGFVTKARLTKKGWQSSCGKHRASDAPCRFYDYNF